MKSLMKVLLVKGILFLITTSVAAQTTDRVQYPVPVFIQIDAPCANFGKGQSIPLGGNWEALYHTVLVGGKQSGFFLYAGKTLKGRGITDNAWYYADGSIDIAFVERDPNTGDGIYDVTTDLQIVSSAGGRDTQRFLYHLRQRFTYANLHTELTFQAPDELVCK